LNAPTSSGPAAPLFGRKSPRGRLPGASPKALLAAAQERVGALRRQLERERAASGFPSARGSRPRAVPRAERFPSAPGRATPGSPAQPSGAAAPELPGPFRGEGLSTQGIRSGAGRHADLSRHRDGRRSHRVEAERRSWIRAQAGVGTSGLETPPWKRDSGSTPRIRRTLWNPIAWNGNCSPSMRTGLPSSAGSLRTSGPVQGLSASGPRRWPASWRRQSSSLRGWRPRPRRCRSRRDSRGCT